MGQFNGSIRVHGGLNAIYRPATLITSENKLQEFTARDTVMRSGTGSLEADLPYFVQGTLAGSASVNLDLIGALLDFAGAAANFAKVKFLRIEADINNNVANDLQIKPHASTGWITGPWRTATHLIQLTPGEAFQWESLVSGRAPVATSGDLITLTNAAGTNTITYRVWILGTSV